MIWASQSLRQNDALWILWVLEKLKDPEYGTNKSVVQGEGGVPHPPWICGVGVLRWVR